MNYTILITLITVCIIGCTAMPKNDMAGSITEKNLTFPPISKKIYVMAGGLVHIKTGYKSGYRFKLKDALDQSVQLGLATIKINPSDELIPSVLEGKEYHCVSFNAYKDMFGFGSSNVCLFEEQGKFTHIRYAPGVYWFKYDFSPPLGITKNEVVVAMNNAYSKKELVYDGSTLGNLMFSEKEYGINLQTPNKTKPIVVKIDSVPNLLDVSGASIKVLEYSSNSLTFTLEKSWD